MLLVLTHRYSDVYACEQLISSNTSSIISPWENQNLGHHRGTHHDASDNSPLYAEGVHMLNGLTEEEMESFVDEHPTIAPLFEIDVLMAVEPYLAKPSTTGQEAPCKLEPESIKELQHARDALDRELAISQRFKASTLEEVNFGSSTEPQTLKIAKDIASKERLALLVLLTEY